jgi:hypothetical protein
MILAAACVSACVTAHDPTDGGGSTRDGRSASGSGATAAEAPRADVLKTICASEFGQGDMASVDVFRNTSGAVAALVLRPDISRFTHAPHSYYAPDGSPLMIVPERPVTPAARNTDPVLKQQDELLRTLVESESTPCSQHR